MSGKRPYNFGAPPGASTSDPVVQWIGRALREIENQSQDDITTVFDAYGFTGTLTETREIDLAAPSAANIAAVFATLISDVKKRGARRTRED